MTDFIFMVRDSSYLFVTGPDVVKTVTQETVTHEELGGAATRRSGVADLAFDNDVQAMHEMRRFIDFLPASNREQPPVRPTTDPAERETPSLDSLVPANPNKPYDMKELIEKVVDERDFFEIGRSSPRTSSSASPAWKARPSASSPISRWCWPAASTSTARARRRASCAFATASTSRS